MYLTTTKGRIMKAGDTVRFTFRTDDGKDLVTEDWTVQVGYGLINAEGEESDLLDVIDAGGRFMRLEVVTPSAGRFLSGLERARLIDLIDLFDDSKVTQIDHDEMDEYSALLSKLQQ